MGPMSCTRQVSGRGKALCFKADLVAGGLLLSGAAAVIRNFTVAGRLSACHTLLLWWDGRWRRFCCLQLVSVGRSWPEHRACLGN